MKKLQEKNINRTKKKEEKGITLITLVITIIIILILAGITIGLVTGDNGVLTQATRATEATEIEQEKEKILLALSTLQIENNGYNKIKEESFQREIDEIFGEGKAKVYTNGYNAFSVMFQEEDKNYRIEEDGTINKIDIALKITNADEFKEFANEVTNGNSFENQYIYLLNDIDLNNEEFEPIGNYVDPSNNKPFAGIFEGNNKKISGININKPGEESGLFPYNIGTIRDLVLESGSITAERAGGFTMRNDGGKIINCANKININTSNNSGGIVGRNDGEIIASYNQGIIQGNGASLGGIVGYNAEGIVNSCYNIGNIINNQIMYAGNTGGISGANTGTISNCFNKGNVDAYSDAVAGIVGINYKDIINCYNLGDITTSTRSIGGIVRI